MKHTESEWQRRQQRMAELARKMREYYLNHGSGCKSRAKAIAAREGR